MHCSEAMDNELATETEHLFDLLTQSLFNPSEDDLPEVDQLFSQVPLPDDFDNLEPAASGTSTDNGRFGPLVTDSEVSNLQEAAVPTNTKKNTTWAMNVWKEWATYRKQLNSANCPLYMLTMSPAELDKWLSRFVLEVRRRNGNVYPPNTL